MTQQITGNEHGNVLEAQIASLLVSKRYAQVVSKHIDTSPGIALFVRQHRQFATLYGARMRLDFFLRHPQRWPDGLAIECKWQQAAGSVDEKFPYVVASLLGLPCPSAIFLAGGGYTNRARDWLLGQQADRLIVIEGMDQIIKWAHAQL
jgi:hypothetical protein